MHLAGKTERFCKGVSARADALYFLLGPFPLGTLSGQFPNQHWQNKRQQCHDRQGGGRIGFRPTHFFVTESHVVRLTQTELSRKSGVPQETISRIERGRANPTMSTLEKLVRAMGTKINLTIG